ncbi:MAG TPA: hypothetical protein VKP66_01290 [Steroidobacteraceae bacterium]|nr:hypothetical protein [Steroidobacteraceae bacterium]
MERPQEGGQIITDIRGHFRVRQNAPDRPRQVLITHFGDPAPLGIIDRKSKRGPEDRVRFLHKPATSEVDAAKLGAGETTAATQQIFHRAA